MGLASLRRRGGDFLCVYCLGYAKGLYIESGKRPLEKSCYKVAIWKITIIKESLEPLNSCNGKMEFGLKMKQN